MVVGVSVQRRFEQLLHDRTVTCATFADSFFGDEGCVQLCEVIAAGSSITALDLRGCNIRTGGAAALAKLLQTNNTLRTLDLEWNGIGSSDEAVAIIADALAVNQGLTSLDLRNNSVSPQGACHLARALGANKALHRLDLRWNDVGVFGGNALAHALEANRTLCEMLLSGNKVCEDALAKIDDLVQRNRSAVRPVRSRRRRCPACRLAAYALGRALYSLFGGQSGCASCIGCRTCSARRYKRMLHRRGRHRLDSARARSMPSGS